MTTWDWRAKAHHTPRNELRTPVGENRNPSLTAVFMRCAGFHVSDGLRLHAASYKRRAHEVRPLPGATDLLAYLTHSGIPWAIATSGRMETAGPIIEKLGVDYTKTPVITRDKVRYAKPDPDLFLAAAAALGMPIGHACVIGDRVWDMLAARRAGGLGVGLLSGGYGEDELVRASAYRVYEDPADLLGHIDEVGGRQ